MKTETLLLIAGAVGVGYLIHKSKTAAPAPTLVAASPRAALLAEPPGAVVVIEPSSDYVPSWYGGGSWGPSWGSYRGGGGGRHGGGHHGHRGRRR